MTFLSFGNNINILALRLDYCGDSISNKETTAKYLNLFIMGNFLNYEKYSSEK